MGSLYPLDLPDPETYEPSQKDLAWCRSVIGMLKVGGDWGIPRCGLIYKKVAENHLELKTRMPWMEDMPIGPERLAAEQNHMHALNVRVFGLVGVKVTNGEKKEKDTPLGADLQGQQADGDAV